MDLTVKNRNGISSLFTDFMNPMQVLGRDFWDLESSLIPKRLGVTVPSANIKETSKDYEIELAAPGLNQKDFSIEINNHTLTISAEKEEEKSKKDEDYFRKEYSFNSFCRTFSLPENIHYDKVKAKYESGVLKVTIPKLEETNVQPTRKVIVS